MQQWTNRQILFDMENRVEADAMDDAELKRLQTKAEMKDGTERLEAFAGALSELVISFAGIAHAPMTLGRS